MRRSFLVIALLGCGHPGTPTHASPTPIATGDAQTGGAHASTKVVSYVALGDSFTIGTGASPEQSFPARWAARWGEACQPKVQNLGVNGYTSHDLIDRELPVLAAVRPTWVSVAIGANDIVAGWNAATYRAHLVTIFAAVRDAGVAPDHVVVVPQPDWSLSPAAAYFGKKADIAARIEAFNAILAEEAAAVGARWVDLFPLMHRQAEAGMIAADDLHPSAAAYDAWGAELSETLKSPCL